MFVEALMPATRDRLATIREDAPLIEAAAQLARSRINLVVTCHSDATIAGVITKTDVVRQLSQCQGSGCTTAASLVMTRDVVVCRPGDWLADVWAMMRERGLKHMPVVDKASRPVGVLYARDALELLLQESEADELLLRDYVLGIGYR
jgi:CBS domain-containing protein